MRGVYPWIYVDYKDNTWKFSLNENKELSYGIMYDEGKWTKETLIDTKVIGFSVYIDENETIHLIYSNTKGELKYCTMKDKQWVGKVIYQVESKDFEIENLKIEIIEAEMHIFYLLIGNDGSDHGVLMHCIWNGQKTKINTLQDIILISTLKEYYSVNTNYRGNLYVFFLSDEGDEISLNYCTFENGMWMPVKRLYGIQGEEIGFEVEFDKQDIHILNKSRENAVYSLDHVSIDSIGNIKDFKVHESRKNLIEPLLFNESNKLSSCWLEENKIFYSVFNGEKWSGPTPFDRGNKFELERYNAFICTDNDSHIKEKKLYGTNGLDLYLYDPSNFLIKIKDSLRYGKNKENESLNNKNEFSNNENEVIENLKVELSRANLENRNLENKISYLNLKIQKNQKYMGSYDEQIAKVLEQKRKAEENCNVFLELQKKIQNELESVNRELAEVKKTKVTSENKVINLKEENDKLLKKITLINLEKDRLLKELEYMSLKLLEEKEEKVLVESKFKEFKEENKMIKEENEIIKKDIELVNEENKKLLVEIELEKNQSVMERLLRRRVSGGQNNL